ncbi:MAG: hypothetical protein RLO12_11480 [Fulvivirga sp.]
MKIGDRIHVHIEDASTIDPQVFSQSPLKIDGTIIEDLGSKWLVRLDIKIGDKTYQVPVKK